MKNKNKIDVGERIPFLNAVKSLQSAGVLKINHDCSGEARRKWMVVPITDLQTLKIYPKGRLDNCNFDRNGKVLLL